MRTIGEVIGGMELPPRLRELLQGSTVEGPILTFADAATPILLDNKTPFFPAYTDHGIVHVERVIATCERLIPEAVWDADLLTANDAAALIGAAVLHDFVMHLREPGFLQLVVPNTLYRPLSWFSKDQSDRRRDVAWPTLWGDFRSEARHLSHTELDRILGTEHPGTPLIAFDNDIRQVGEWTEFDRLLVGEFLRRHHARLAHEVALRGLPVGDGDALPLLSGVPAGLADTIGAIARSHNESLRTMVGYFDTMATGSLRRADVLTTYAMALLRSADYVQLDSDRAPSSLLRLKQPQSQNSIDEWNKHGAIGSISWDTNDPYGMFFEVGSTHRLQTHLQLVALLDDVQAELDRSTAVLGQVYSQERFRCLELAKQRITSNLNDSHLHDHLPYVPIDARVRSSDDLFRLVVGDLYGDFPEVAGRELLQNAIDAVRAWPLAVSRSNDLFTQAADVEVQVISNGDWATELRVADRGVGMTPETIERYFLRAGASYAASLAGPRDQDPPLKTGRFGVGAFGAFLAGPSITVRSRHVGSDRGVKFIATLGPDPIEMQWIDCPIGTEVRVSLRDRPLINSLTFLDRVSTFYAASSPSVAFEIVSDAGELEVLSTPTAGPSPTDPNHDSWRAVVAGPVATLFFKSAHRSHAQVTHNAIAIKAPGRGGQDRYEFAEYRASRALVPPDVSIYDPAHALNISLTRYDVPDRRIGPFESALLEGIGLDIVAHALVYGPKRYPLARDMTTSPVIGRDEWCPLLPGLDEAFMNQPLLLLWSPRGAASEFLVGAASTDEFIDWETAPLRMLATSDNLTPPQSDDEHAFRSECTAPAHELGYDLTAWALVPERTADGGARALDDRQTGGQRSEDIESVSAAAIAIAERTLGHAIGLCLLQRRAESRTRQPASFERAWAETIHGPLPRDLGRLEEARARVRAEGGPLAIMIEQWTRLSERAHVDFD